MSTTLLIILMAATYGQGNFTSFLEWLGFVAVLVCAMAYDLFWAASAIDTWMAWKRRRLLEPIRSPKGRHHDRM